MKDDESDFGLCCISLKILESLVGRLCTIRKLKWPHNSQPGAAFLPATCRDMHPITLDRELIHVLHGSQPWENPWLARVKCNFVPVWIAPFPEDS